VAFWDFPQFLDESSLDKSLISKCAVDLLNRIYKMLSPFTETPKKFIKIQSVTRKFFGCSKAAGNGFSLAICYLFVITEPNLAF
jgi:hypothetical protein